MIRPAPIGLAESTPSRRAVSDDCHGRARLNVGRVGGKPAGAHDVREREQARMMSSEGISGVATRVPSASGSRSSDACASPMNFFSSQDDC